ncbi:hypothetical protein [Aquimarina sp. RZ0]|uniref:hypothetical protein n=1 Tax=Aquimarina sp. RZ0 TaxID=2607730 RepID=UPI0011F19106|nr:hypothetical protein [Aquimarina sp. RZ0]KAA1244924.1 hypothetical protein F0000_14380 [Aquimarina sp. RZ0]
MKKTNYKCPFKLKIFALFMILLVINIYGQTKSFMIQEEEEVHVKRSSILISDLNRSLKIYQDILGFKVVIIAESDKESYAYPVFRMPKKSTIRVATLNYSDQNPIINLKEITGITLPKPISGPFMSTILIKVKELKSIMEKIQNLGLESTKVHMVKGKRISYKEQFFVNR